MSATDSKGFDLENEWHPPPQMFNCPTNEKEMNYDAIVRVINLKMTLLCPS